MKSRLQSLLVIMVVGGTFTFQCTPSQKFETQWSTLFENLGSGSSPSCTDLNGDGIMDVVMGAARNEYEISDSSVVALNGKNGEVLWTVTAKDQIVGSPVFLDVNQDGTLDVFIGGRSAELMCINGKTGKAIWRFQKSDSTYIQQCCFRYNFFNAQLIPDQTGDKIQDLLVSNGGNAKAKPNTREGRHPGVLAIMNSVSGAVVAADTMPDRNETYMSPVVHDFKGNGKLDIIFGTGGETLGGDLYRIPLDSLLANNIKSAIPLAKKEGKGFIAPVTIADINRDGTADIITNWFGGSIIAFDGKNNHQVWEVTVPATESYSMAVPGYYDADDVPDFFATFNKGAWPDNKGSIQLMVNGKDGKILFSDSLGCLGYSSPVSFDTNGDGFDEVMWSVNDFVCDPPSYIETDIINAKHAFYLYDNIHGKKYEVMPSVKAKNISSTPWIGDLDNDGFLEIIACVQRNDLIVDHYHGIQVERINTNIPSQRTVSWGSYLGPGSTSVFVPRKN